MGTRPLVHTGFYAAWTSKGLDVQILGHLRVGACCWRDGHALWGPRAVGLLQPGGDLRELTQKGRMLLVCKGLRRFQIQYSGCAREPGRCAWWLKVTAAYSEPTG